MNSKLLLRAENYFLVTFPTTHNALRAEKILESLNISFLIVPTPREISAGCGLSIRFFEEDLSEIKQSFNKENLTFSDVYQVNNGKFEQLTAGGV